MYDTNRIENKTWVVYIDKTETVEVSEYGEN
jgi:hypothetical protein